MSDVTTGDRWLVIDGPHKPKHVHLYDYGRGQMYHGKSKPHVLQWREPVGDEVKLPQCELCLAGEARRRGR
jgi:hypothetical protein